MLAPVLLHIDVHETREYRETRTYDSSSLTDCQSSTGFQSLSYVVVVVGNSGEATLVTTKPHVKTRFSSLLPRPYEQSVPHL